MERILHRYEQAGPVPPAEQAWGATLLLHPDGANGTLRVGGSHAGVDVLAGPPEP